MAWEVGHPLKRDGTSQRQRLPDLLRPQRVPIDARQPEELLAMLHRLAKQFAYYNFQDEADGTWEDFFPAEFLRKGELSLDGIRTYLSKAVDGRNTGPFMTILLSFLHLYRYLQDDINRLTGEHLEFYYEQVLGFRRRPPKPDEVHVIFELSPQVDQQRIPAGTALKAGSDQTGKLLTYLTSREIIVNKAQLAQIKTVLVEPDGRIYAAEVANSADGLGAPLTGTPPKWPTFGDAKHMQLSTVGFAIASHLLLLQEGQRKITLTLTFEKIPDSLAVEALFERLIPYASGAEDWIPLGLTSTKEIRANQVEFSIVVRPDQPAILPFDSEKLDGNLDTTWPVLRMLLEPNHPPYTALKDLSFKQIALEVAVTATSSQPGIQQLIVQNDQGLLDAGGSFQPFGPTPSKGSQFYIGSREVFSKPLSNLNVQVTWADLPGDPLGFADYYNEGGYTAEYKDNSKYTVDIEVLNRSAWDKLEISSPKLFATAEKRLQATQNISIGSLGILNIALNLPEFEEWNTSLLQGFIRLILKQDFGHRLYPKIFAEIAASNKTIFPNPPYTPTIQSISLGYQASQTIRLDEPEAQAQVFHILPFGSEVVRSEASLSFLPTLTQGSLYLGLENFQPPQNLHLLFQALEGSSTSVDSVLSEDIQWSYGATDGWESLSGREIFTDTTQGLQQPGIIAFSIGRNATKETTGLPQGLHWLRATVEKNPAGAARMIEIHPQAVTAVYQDQGNDPNHLLTPLTAESISALVVRDGAIKKVAQPYASFDGTPAEQDERFFTRVSERLRHKQRAVSIWDYERLVLAQFPDIYKAKTIPHTGLDAANSYSEFLPGYTSMVVIPQLRNQNAVNPLEPKASVALREEVRRYLLPYTTYFLGRLDQRLQVINPSYEPILLSFSVGFREGFDGGFYAEVLNEALRRHLSPWAFDEGADIAFGGKVYKSQLLAFVEEQAYVDYVTDFKLFHLDAGPGIGEMCINLDFIVRSIDPGDEVEVASASTAASILVSADQHQINVLQPGTFPCNEPNICEEGIGCWYINIDFRVS